MEHVQRLEPEQIVENSPARFFLILFLVEDQVYSFTGHGFDNIENGNMRPFRREDAVKQYYVALRTARDWNSGNLELIPIPKIEV